MKELPEDIQAKIIAYIDGDLPADEAAALEVYLVNTDPGMSEMVIGMMADRQSISVLPKISAPNDLASRVMEQLERASLLHGVEQDLQRARKPWWQTRPAIAAAVAVFVGGFSLIIIQTIYRPQGPGEVTTGRPTSNTAIARVDNPGGPDAAMSKAGVGGGGGMGAGRNITDGTHGKFAAGRAESGDINSAKGLNKAAAGPSNLKTKNGAPAWLVIDTRETIEDKLSRIQRTIDRPVAHDYLEASTPQDALTNVSAAPDDALAGPPVVLYIEARDVADAGRLEKRLAEFMNEADFAPNSAVEESPAESAVAFDGKSSDNWRLSGDVNKKSEPGSSFGGGIITVNGGTLQQAPVITGVVGNTSTTVTAGTLNVTSAVIGGAGASSITNTVGGITLNNKAGAASNNNTIDISGIPVDQAAGIPANHFNQNQNKGDVVIGNNDALSFNNDAAQNLKNNGLSTTAATNLTGGNTYTGNTLNAGIAVSNASQAKNLHNGIPRGGTQYDNNLGAYAVNPNFREYTGRVNGNGNSEHQQPSRPQQDLKAQDNQKAKESLQDSNFVGEAGQPYRVYLSPEQLDQVTTEFRVRSVNRGQVTYVIPETPAQSQTPGMKNLAQKTNEKDLAKEREKAVAAQVPKPGGISPAKPSTQAATTAPILAEVPAAAPAPVTKATEAKAAKDPIAAKETLADSQSAGQKGGGQSVAGGRKGAAQAGGQQNSGQQAGGEQLGGGQQAGGFGGAGGGGAGAGIAPSTPTMDSEQIAGQQPESKQGESKQSFDKSKAEASGDEAARRTQSQRLEVIISIQPPAGTIGKYFKPEAAATRDATLHQTQMESEAAPKTQGK